MWGWQSTSVAKRNRGVCAVFRSFSPILTVNEVPPLSLCTPVLIFRRDYSQRRRPLLSVSHQYGATRPHVGAAVQTLLDLPVTKRPRTLRPPPPPAPRYIHQAAVEREESADAIRGDGPPDVETVFSQVRNGRLKRLEDSLERGFFVDAEDEFGNTALMVACQVGGRGSGMHSTTSTGAGQVCSYSPGLRLLQRARKPSREHGGSVFQKGFSPTQEASACRTWV